MDPTQTKMNDRLALSDRLNAIPGVAKVYFQPPDGTKMKYPCIVYEVSDGTIIRADNQNYHYRRRYSVTVIDKNPDSSIPDVIIKEFNLLTFDRTFIVDNLYHTVFSLYY